MKLLSLGGALASGALLMGAVLSTPVSAVSVVQAASTSHRVTGHQEFLLVSTNPNEESGGPIAATGPIHAKGTDKVVSNRKDLFKFPAGDLAIKHKPKKGAGHESFDAATCLFSFTEKGTWKVDDGSTGAYANAKGGGSYKVVGLGFGCDPNTPPDVFSLTIRAKGDLSY
jgi:hypothetical protein